MWQSCKDSIHAQHECDVHTAVTLTGLSELKAHAFDGLQ